MLTNKITEPQAVYAKAPAPGEAAHQSSFTTPPPKKRGKLNWKVVGGILAVCLLSVVGVAGVLIAQRQQADPAPVAPNAPASRPAAAIPEDQACSVSFVVSTTTPPPTTPPPTTPPPSTPPPTTPPPTTVPKPPAGVARCISKEAFSDSETPHGNSPQNPASLVRRGDNVTYKIVVRANTATGGPVVIKDVLPDALAFQPGTVRINGKAPTPAEFPTPVGQTLTFNISTLAQLLPVREVVIHYKATVREDAEIAPFSNTVTVSTNGTPAPTPDACEVTLQVAPVGVASCQAKEAFTDYGGTRIPNDTVIEKGTTFAYKLTVTATEQTAGSVAVIDTLPSAVEFVESRNNTLQHNNGRLSATLPPFGDSPADRTKVFEYKVKVKDDAASGKFENSVSVVTSSKSTQADSCKLTLHLPYQCNSNCTTDAQCNNNGSGTTYICSEEAGNKCRLASNPESSSCSPASPEYSCNSSCTSNSQCQEADEDYVCAPTSQGNRCRHKDNTTSASCSVPSTPTPTPAIGCNDSCVSNADCSNPSHICYNDGTSQVCRLQTNPSSSSCSSPVASTPSQPQQPQLPEELPQTGPEDWINWLKAGLITLGIGAALLLLL